MMHAHRHFVQLYTPRVLEGGNHAPTPGLRHKDRSRPGPVSLAARSSISASDYVLFLCL